jgi:hypothetical protein
MGTAEPSSPAINFPIIIMGMVVLGGGAVALTKVADNYCPIVSESFTGVYLLDAIDNSKCIYQFGKLIAGDDGSAVLRNSPCRSIVTPSRYE